MSVVFIAFTSVILPAIRQTKFLTKYIQLREESTRILFGAFPGVMFLLVFRVNCPFKYTFRSTSYKGIMGSFYGFRFQVYELNRL